jgi:hypothetical protein
MDYLSKILIDFELLSVNGIRECFKKGVDPNLQFNNKPLIYELISQYARGPKFKECIKAFTEYSLEFDDVALLAVLLDDSKMLEAELKENPKFLQKRYSFKSAFTPLLEASLLHISAEHNHLSCAKILVKYGLDINLSAGYDENGFGGQTAIFHTVNQNGNKCIDVMNYLISESADLHYTVKGIIWGKGYDWETFIPAVNPISYAMMGLLPQFQRSEDLIYGLVSILMNAAYGTHYIPQNIPNKYLNKS